MTCLFNRIELCVNDIHALRKIIEKDTRYPVEAYLFVLEALHFTRKRYKKQKHVSGQELLEGIKELALTRYGSMTKAVFEHWGIRKTMDFGNIVFNMVNEKVLNKTEEDSIDDFKNVYDFNEVFVRQYRFKLKGLKNGNK